MTEQTTGADGTGASTGTPAATGAEPTETQNAARIGQLETKIDQILTAIGKGEQGAHAAAEQHEQAKLDRPTAIADEVRSQIDQARAREAEQADREGQKSELAALQAELKELREKMPGQPQRRIERIWA